MNRLHHLKKTLAKNIRSNILYKDVEFVLLNYNSSDELRQWIEKSMMGYIQSGLLIYLETFEPRYWEVAHAKNMVTKYASGDIVCNIDADHFTGFNYAGYINTCFNKDDAIFLTGRTSGASFDSQGRICMWKSDFLRLRGYNEEIVGYGYDDTDICSRLAQIGKKEIGIELKFLKSIRHSHFERLKNTKFIDDIKFILLCEGQGATRAFIMKQNGKFEHVEIILFKDEKLEALVFDENTVEVGDWAEIDNDIVLTDQKQESAILKATDTPDTYLYKGVLYTKITGRESRKAFLNYALLLNAQVYKRYKIAQPDSVNLSGFGSGLVFRNFDYEQAIPATD